MRRFTLPFTCKQCQQNKQNLINGDAITYITAGGKEYEIGSNNEVEIVHDSDEKPIDINDFKDALLSSLYGQVEFLRSQLEEKDLLIKTIIIRDNVLEITRAILVVIRDPHATEGMVYISSDNDDNDSDHFDDCNSTYSNSDRCSNGEYVDEIEDG